MVGVSWQEQMNEFFHGISNSVDSGGYKRTDLYQILARGRSSEVRL